MRVRLNSMISRRTRFVTIEKKIFKFTNHQSTTNKYHLWHHDTKFKKLCQVDNK